jgi:hypothetical protein
MQYSSLDEPESAAAVAAAAVAASLSANNSSNNNNHHHHGSNQSVSSQSQTRQGDHQDNNNNDDVVSYKTNKSNKSNRTRGGRTIHSELEEPLNDVELGGPSSYNNNSPLDDDPFYVLRNDLYRKLELVDEGLAEFIRIVYQTVCI